MSFLKHALGSILLSILMANILFAQTEDELFDNATLNSDSSSIEGTNTSEEISSESQTENTESVLDDELEFPNESDLQEPMPAVDENSNTEETEISDTEITEEVQSLSGSNAKPNDSSRVKFIKHPGQKHGLYKISADGKYYYKVDESPQKYGLAIKLGMLNLNQLQNAETDVTFNSIYGSSAKTSLYVEYYWSYFKNKNVPQILKKARVKIGSGLLFASGKGDFIDPNYVGVQARESYTFLAFPNHLGLNLSFEFKDKQLIVPYVTGAFEYLVGVELQNSNFSRTKFLGQLGAHVGGGLALSLGWLDEAAKFDLDSEFGINQSYLTVELRQNIPIQSDFSFAATFINAGVQFEF